MKTKSLAESNPYLKNRALARKRVIRNIASSTAIETSESIETIENKLKKKPARYRVGLA